MSLTLYSQLNSKELENLNKYKYCKCDAFNFAVLSQDDSSESKFLEIQILGLFVPCYKKKFHCDCEMTWAETVDFFGHCGHFSQAILPIHGYGIWDSHLLVED